MQAGQIAAVFNGLRQRDLPGVKSGAKGWSDYRIRWHPFIDLDLDTSLDLDTDLDTDADLDLDIDLDIDLDTDPGLFSCSKEIDLDIGKQEESLANYRATLSHKCCHSFKPNSHFAQFWHPM